MRQCCSCTQSVQSRWSTFDVRFHKAEDTARLSYGNDGGKPGGAPEMSLAALYGLRTDITLTSLQS